MIKITKSLLFITLLLSIFFPSCEEEDEVSVNEEPINLNLDGVSQKGPFVIGSSVTIQELNDEFSPTGTSFQVATIDDKGSFTLNSPISTEFVEVICNGFYFNEVSGLNTNSNLTVRSILQVEEDLNSNLNLLTTLTSRRVIHLVVENDLAFPDAKKQAEKELLLAFNITSDDVASFDNMDISGNAESDAILVALSVVLQGNGSVSDLSVLLANIVQDLEEDGTIDNPETLEKISENAISIALDDIRLNLESKYEELGESIQVPEFEKYVQALYENTPPQVTIQNPTEGMILQQGDTAALSVQISDREGRIDSVNVFLNDSLVSTTDQFRWRVEDTTASQWLKVEAIDDEGAVGVDSVNFTVKINTLPTIEITNINENDEFDAGEELDIALNFFDEENRIESLRLFLDDLEIWSIGTIFNSDSLGFRWQVRGSGEQYLRAEIKDEQGGMAVDSVLISIVENQKPTLNVLQPLSGAEVIYSNQVEIDLEVADLDGYLTEVKWYVEDEFAGELGMYEYGFEPSTIQANGSFTITDIKKDQILKVVAIDNVNDSTIVEIPLLLREGAYWEEYKNFDIRIFETATDGENLYVLSENSLQKVTDLEFTEELIAFDGTTNVTLLKNSWQDSIYFLESNYAEEKTYLRSSADQGATWNSQELNYVPSREIFIHSNTLYARAGSNLYQLQNDSLVRLSDSQMPWKSDPITSAISSVTSFGNKMVALQGNMVSFDRKIWLTSDLTVWEESSIELQRHSSPPLARGLIEFNNQLWIFSTDGDIFRSPDGINWQELTTGSSTGYDKSLVSLNGDLLILYDNGAGTTIYRLIEFGQ